MNEIEDVEANRVLGWHRLTNFAAAGMLQKEINKAIKSMPKPSRYEQTGHSNCKYCRKKCKLFKQNQCWNKSINDQLKCEFNKDK